ncbi:MAG: type VI secretion system tip protein TssI/VgrG [Pseudomonadota bacterium]
MPAARAIYAKTPLPDGVLRFASMTGTDRVSSCFHYHITFATDDYDVDPNDILGKQVTVHVENDFGERFFDGYVDEFGLTEFAEERLRYTAVIRPALWFLSKASDNRIFQEMNVVDIVEKVLSDYSEVRFLWELQETYPKREYCVQYGESDLNFIQRLLEDEGIFYYFRHGDAEHTLVLTDEMAKLAHEKGYESLPYAPDGGTGRDIEEVINRWTRTAAAVSGSQTETDYDFTKPSADLKVRSSTPFSHDLAEMKLYDYPGVYSEVSRGETRAGIRLQEQQAGHQRATAESNAIGPYSGALLTLEGYPREAENDTYLILEASYDMEDAQYRAGGGGEAGFTARYTLMPKSIPFRPLRVSPWPVMKGPQTAVVTGPSGEEIFTDEYSRVKVQFHWDRVGNKDDKTTCFIRVSSTWAGSGWGFIQIPRIGEEVIVDFLEGDPDQPLITGRVYNANQMPPYGLPGSATQSGWKSNSSPGGGGWNELRFEDKAGEEEVYFQAQKDHNELVKNNESRAIGNDFLENVGHDATQNISNDRTETVGNNKSTQVGVDRMVAIGSNDTESVGVDRSLTVGSNEAISIGSNSTETIGSNHSQSVAVNQTLSVGAARSRRVGAAEAVTVGAAQAITVGAARTVTVGADQTHTIASDDSWTIGSSQGVTIGSDQTVSMGGQQSVTIGASWAQSVAEDASMGIGGDWMIGVGATLSATAEDEINLICGDASITLKKDGTITLKGKDISLDASGKINLKASSDITLKGSKIKQN